MQTLTEGNFSGLTVHQVDHSGKEDFLHYFDYHLVLVIFAKQKLHPVPSLALLMVFKKMFNTDFIVELEKK